MKSDYILQVDHLAVGLTQPVIRFGVPLLAFFSNVMVCFLGWMLYQIVTHDQSLWGAVSFLVLFTVMHILMFIITFRDAYGLAIGWVNVMAFRKLANHRFWSNTDSYLP